MGLESYFGGSGAPKWCDKDECLVFSVGRSKFSISVDSSRGAYSTMFPLEGSKVSPENYNRMLFW